MLVRIQIIIVSLLLSTACLKPPRYKAKSHTTDALLKDKLTYLETLYSNEDLCADYQLLNNLIYYLQNDAAQKPNLAAQCSKDYSEFVAMTRKAISDLEDLHTGVEFGNGIDAIKAPVVVKCEGDVRCPSLLGTALFNIHTSVVDKFYAIAFTAKQVPLPLSVLSVDGRSIASYKPDMDKDLLYSHTKGNWTLTVMDYIFNRNVITERDLDPLEVEVEDLATHNKMKLKLAYNVPQTILSAPEALLNFSSLGVSRGYGCSKVLEGSGYTGGACLDKTGKIIVWLYAWTDVVGFQEWVKKLGKWLVANKGSETTIHFDLRNNSGGDPLSVVDFICTFGSETTITAIDKMSLDVRTWPGTFQIAGQKLLTEEMKAFDNLQFRKIDESFVVEDGKVSPTRSRSITTWERAKTDLATCQGKTLADLKNMKWKVLTNGNEFSSSEDFLFLAQSDPTKFQIYGHPTMGGSGNPSWIPLPRTNTGIRLSTARDIYDNKVIIEKKGIFPDVPLDAMDSAEEFDKRFVSIIKGAPIVDYARDDVPKSIRSKFFLVP